MSILSRIKSIKPEYYISDEFNYVTAMMEYNGLCYADTAYCHDEDAEFFSVRVGKRIATYKLRIRVLTRETAIAKKEWETKNNYYREVLGFGSKEPAEVDPTGAFKRNLERAAARYHMLQNELNKQKQLLREYLEALQKSHAIVKKFREGLANNG